MSILVFLCLYSRYCHALGFHYVPVSPKVSLDMFKPSQPVLNKLFFNWCYP
uniref:Uncharacterized protein n=1 Tax=Setaria viridis TaxID=4556 RepID=A0A4U6VJN0_SETVI|nr:hypothetical protein SEVIR_3G349150v2 [Setaria viridis]